MWELRWSDWASAVSATHYCNVSARGCDLEGCDCQPLRWCCAHLTGLKIPFIAFELTIISLLKTTYVKCCISNFKTCATHC